MNAVDFDHAMLYAVAVHTVLPQAARHYLEAMMVTLSYRDETTFVGRYFTRGYAEGEAAGEADAILTVLEARGIEIPDDTRARITECTDVGQLDIWVRRAATITSADELFD